MDITVKNSEKKSRSQRRRERARDRENPAPSTIVYKGPVVARSNKQEEAIVSTLLTVSGSLSSDSAGKFITFLSDNISLATDWTSYSAAYSEYRILGIKLIYMPVNRYSKVTTITTPAIVAIDRAKVSLPTSYAQLMQYESARPVSLEDPWSIEAKMNGIEDAGFVPITTVYTGFGFPLYGDGMSASTMYGKYFFYWRVQFRGRA